MKARHWEMAGAFLTFPDRVSMLTLLPTGLSSCHRFLMPMAQGRATQGDTGGAPPLYTPQGNCKTEQQRNNFRHQSHFEPYLLATRRFHREIQTCVRLAFVAQQNMLPILLLLDHSSPHPTWCGAQHWRRFAANLQIRTPNLNPISQYTTPLPGVETSRIKCTYENQKAITAAVKEQQARPTPPRARA